MTETQNTLLKTILSVASKYKVDKFKYSWHIIWDFPQHAIYVNDMMLHPNEFNIPQNYSQRDIDELVKLGYFEMIEEIKIDDVTYETEVIYKIIK